MSAAQVQEALTQVRELKNKVMDRQRFRGYNGVARAAGGTLALITAAVLSHPAYPHTSLSHADGWGWLALAGLIINGGALIWWFATNPDSKRDPRRLAPVFGVLPPFLVGCALTLAALLHFDYEYLFGIWMCCYGLMHLSQNLVLPWSIRLLGLYYITCGVLMLLIFDIPFTNPWPMGAVFFVGEWIGALIFIKNRMPEANWYEIVFHKDRGQ